jgi:CTP:molybdopterin cytidylyltransferase MocA
VAEVAGLVLAAGAGRRFGMPKALVRIGDRLFVEHAAEVLTAGGCAPVVVVLGAGAPDVRATARLPGVSLVDNPDWESGMGSSLRAGLRALAGSEATGVLVIPVDTPGITAAAVRRLRALAHPDALARATYHGDPGHPVLIGRNLWARASDAATGDVGAQPLLVQLGVTEVPCEDVAFGQDVDRPSDLG